MKQYEMVVRASNFAKKHHINQKRRINGVNYAYHPAETAYIVDAFKRSKHLDILLTAALLHDVIEDCNISIEEIEKEFGSFVASIVQELTNDNEAIKKFGKKQYMIYKVLTITNYALVIKLADRLHNIIDIDGAEKSWREKYIDETQLLISVLRKFRKLTNSQENIVKEIEKFI